MANKSGHVVTLDRNEMTDQKDVWIYTERQEKIQGYSPAVHGSAHGALLYLYQPTYCKA